MAPRERYQALDLPNVYSAKKLRAEFDRVQRGIPWPGAVDVRDFGVPTNGTSDGYAALAKATAALAETGGTIRVPRGATVRLATSLTLAADIAVEIEPGGMFSVDSGRTLTLNGPLFAGQTQIFSGAGTFRPHRPDGGLFYPQWWGALADGENNDRDAIVAATAAAANSGTASNLGGTVFFPAGAYGISSNCPINTRVRWQGHGRGASTVIALDDFPVDTALVTLGSTGSGFGSFIEDLAIDGNDIDGSIGVRATTLEEMSGLRRCFVRNCRQYCIHFGNGGTNTVQQYTLDRVECNLSVNADSTSIGIWLQVHNNGGLAFVRDLSLGRLATGAGTCLRLDGVSGHLSGIHIEGCTTDGILIGEASPCTGLVISGVDANPAASLTNAIRISNAVGTKSRNVTIQAVRSNASMLLIDDDVTGLTITDSDLGVYAFGKGSPLNSAVYPHAIDEITETPAALAAGDNNDYAIDARTRTLRLQANGAGSTLTGLAGGVAQRRITIVHLTAANLTLGHQDTASAEANRMISPTGADVVLAQNDIATLQYDGSTARWRIVSVNT